MPSLLKFAARSVLFIALCGVSYIAEAVVPPTPYPGQEGTYVGTIKETYYNKNTGKKETDTGSVIMVINPNGSVSLSIFSGSSIYNCTYAHFTPSTVGFYAGTDNNYAFTGLFTIKNGSAKGTYQLISTSNGSTGKMTMKKSAM